MMRQSYVCPFLRCCKAQTVSHESTSPKGGSRVEMMPPSILPLMACFTGHLPATRATHTALNTELLVTMAAQLSPCMLHPQCCGWPSLLLLPFNKGCNNLAVQLATESFVHQALAWHAHGTTSPIPRNSEHRREA